MALGQFDSGDIPAAVEEDETAARFRYELGELLAISRAMASERDIRKLLDLILTKTRQITGADAGSVYVVETDEGDDGQGGDSSQFLHFMLSQNDSISMDLKQFKLPVDDKSIAGQAVLTGQPIVIEDLARLAEPGQNPGGFQHNRSVDQKTGYQTRSMLTVPMLSARQEVIGVIQLINRKRERSKKLLAPADFDAEVVAFDGRSAELALALAAQAGVCLENATLYEEIRSLFEGFVDASVTAIESRDPSTSGHSRRVATLSVALAEKVDAISDGPLSAVRFSREDLRQIEYAGVLHDFGKVGVRENVLTKAKKLHDGQALGIELRFRFIRAQIEIQALQEELRLVRDRAEASAVEGVREQARGKLREVDAFLRLMHASNEPALTRGTQLDQLRDLAAAHYVDIDGARRPYLEPDELQALRIPRGSLTEVERQEIQSHVTHTMQFLETIPWGRAFRNIPRIAGGHHETLDGRGYPKGLKGDQIRVETRMLTIADIFDALTAADRPYKSAVPVERALDILASEVKAGKVDPLLFDVFVSGNVYRNVV